MSHEYMVWSRGPCSCLRARTVFQGDVLLSNVIFTRLDEKFMPALATGLTVAVD